MSSSNKSHGAFSRFQTDEERKQQAAKDKAPPRMIQSFFDAQFKAGASVAAEEFPIVLKAAAPVRKAAHKSNAVGRQFKIKDVASEPGGSATVTPQSSKMQHRQQRPVATTWAVLLTKRLSALEIGLLSCSGRKYDSYVTRAEI